jgi:RNA polymerase sigma factor (sigma-70 family)
MELASDNFKDNVRNAYTRACSIITSPEVENMLILKAKKGNKYARNILFEKQLPALIKLASRNSYAVFKGNAAELVSEVFDVFENAISLYNPSMGLRFWTFLSKHAMNAMNKAKYEDRLIHVPENYVKQGRANEYAAIESGYLPIAADDSHCLFDTLEGDSADTVIDESAMKEYRGITNRIMDGLDSPERELVKKCYLETEPDADGNPGNKPWSITSLAKFSGTSKEYLRQKHKHALAKLRKNIEADCDWVLDPALA